MRKHALMMSALAVSLALPMAALADPQGRGNGHGGDHAGHGAERAGHENGNENGNHGRGNGRGDEARAERNSGNGNGNGNNGRGEDRADHDNGRGNDARNRVEVAHPANAGRDDRGPRSDDVGGLVRHDQGASRGLIEGCPPGLAWRDNGCLPPGQARRLEREASYDWLWNQSRDGGRYTYVDGYLYEVRPGGGLAGWIPVLGGALGLNNIWPQQYTYDPVPTYYSRYSGLGDRYDYRYANGVVYGVDPQTQAIQQVAALLTGQSWNVGQAMPRGYDAYNVPYAYREQYKDTPDRWYRYNDGYVYQVDPTTRLVQAVIELLS